MHTYIEERQQQADLIRQEAEQRFNPVGNKVWEGVPKRQTRSMKSLSLVMITAFVVPAASKISIS